MTYFSEILPAQAKKRRTKHFGRAADKIMHLRLKRSTVAVVPGVRRDVAVFGEDCSRIPIQRFPLKPVAALENENAFARRSKMPGQRTTASAAADDDDVKLLIHSG